ncbi:MAG: hypothetical protein ACYSWW_17575 [Planctomycetota bacterium]|jgi:chromosome segregation ATPase
MTKQKVILVCTTALVFPLVLTGCYRAELTRAETALEETESERDELQMQVNTVMQTRARDLLQKRVNELTGSLDRSEQQVSELADSRYQLQKQVEELTTSRDALQKQADELTLSRNSALAEMWKAKKEIDALTTQLDTETRRVLDLQNQLKQVQIAIAELQQRFAP